MRGEALRSSRRGVIESHDLNNRPRRLRLGESSLVLSESTVFENSLHPPIRLGGRLKTAHLVDLNSVDTNQRNCRDPRPQSPKQTRTPYLMLDVLVRLRSPLSPCRFVHTVGRTHASGRAAERRTTCGSRIPRSATPKLELGSSAVCLRSQSCATTRLSILDV